jgi:flagellar biosynthesis regulator FlbT
MKREHKWNKEDAIITFYYSEYGTVGLLVTNEKELAESVIGSSLDSLKMMVLNFKNLRDKESGFEHFSEYQEQVFEKYHNTPKNELKEIINNIIISRDQVKNKEEYQAAKKIRDAKAKEKERAINAKKELDAAFRRMGKDPNKMKRVS